MPVLKLLYDQDTCEPEESIGFTCNKCGRGRHKKRESREIVNKN